MFCILLAFIICVTDLLRYYGRKIALCYNLAQWISPRLMLTCALSLFKENYSEYWQFSEDETFSENALILMLGKWFEMETHFSNVSLWLLMSVLILK